MTGTILKPLLAACALAGTSAHARDCPVNGKPIRIIVPTAPSIISSMIHVS